jgi:hypothetical protein
MLKNIFGLVNNTQNPTPNSPQYITNNKNTNISPETVKKMNVFYKLLDTVCATLDDKQIPFYLDCGTLLGCIREGRLLSHDSDIDITIHLSRWEQLLEIDYSKYGLVLKRKYKGFPDYSGGNLISVHLHLEMPYPTRAALHRRSEA